MIKNEAKIVDVRSEQSLSFIILRYVLAGFLPFLSFLLAYYAFAGMAKLTPLLFFFPAVAISAWVGGVRAGVLSSFVSSIFIVYFFIPPFYSIYKSDVGFIFQVILFMLEGIVVSYFISSGKDNENLLNLKEMEIKYKENISQLESVNETLVKEIKLRDEFLSIASHELKTPLTSMLLQTQTALHSIKNVSLAHFSINSLLTMLESVENQTKRLSKMINDLFNVSILSTGNMQLETEKVNLTQVVTEVINDFAVRLEKEHYEVIFKKPKEDAIGEWDRIRIVQAISNLLSNAIKYGKRKPIEIKIEKKLNYVHLSVIDHGIGISWEKQKRIFNLFERGVDGDEYKGLGVGLYISSQIAVAHGGKLYVTSRVNHGAKFVMELPLSKQQS